MVQYWVRQNGLNARDAQSTQSRRQLLQNFGMCGRHWTRRVDQPSNDLGDRLILANPFSLQSSRVERPGQVAEVVLERLGEQDVLILQTHRLQFFELGNLFVDLGRKKCTSAFF